MSPKKKPVQKENSLSTSTFNSFPAINYCNGLFWKKRLCNYVMVLGSGMWGACFSNTCLPGLLPGSFWEAKPPDTHFSHPTDLKWATKKITLLRVIPTMTCWVEVVRWGLSSSSRSEAVWEWIQDSMGCQFVEELRFVSASRPPPRLRQQHQQLLTKFHFHITPVIHLPLFSILRLNTPKPNQNVILCAHRVSILSITKFSLHIHLCQSDRVRWG